MSNLNERTRMLRFRCQWNMVDKCMWLQRDFAHTLPNDDKYSVYHIDSARMPERLVQYVEVQDEYQMFEYKFYHHLHNQRDKRHISTNPKDDHASYILKSNSNKLEWFDYLLLY